MRRPASLVVIVTLLGVVWTSAPGHAEPPAEKAAHGQKEARATLQPSAHKLSAPSAAHPASGDTAPDAKTSAGSHDEAGTRSPRKDAPHVEKELKAVRPALARPPNPALEAVLQRLNRRIAAARSPERAHTERAGHEPHGRSTAKAPRAAAAPTPTFRVQVTAPHASEPSATPRVRLTWRPTVIWPRAVLPGSDADDRVQLEWPH